MERKPASNEAEMQNEKCKMQNEQTGAGSAGTDAFDGLPEADDSENDGKTQKRVARLETLRRWMLILAPVLLLGGYASDCLPILYASALPLAVALIVTYRIKHLEEK